jgi:hypothetical protein
MPTLPGPFRRPHPARLVLVDRRISIAAVAEQMEREDGERGYNPSHVSAVLSKRHPATPAFRVALAKLLDLPENELFDDQPPSERKSRFPGNELLGATS